jgi:hypothetical protein
MARGAWESPTQANARTRAHPRIRVYPHGPMPQPYRASSRPVPSGVLLCSACGARVALFSGAERVRCDACGLDQPAMREAFDAHPPLVFESRDERRCSELDAFAAHVGAPPRCSELRLRAAGVPVRV